MSTDDLTTERPPANEPGDDNSSQRLADFAPVGIFRTSPQGDYVYVNRRWTELAGLAADEAPGAGWVEALHPDDRAGVLALWQQEAAARRAFRTEYRFRRSDGQELWVLEQVVPEQDASGTFLGYIGTVTELTDQKQAETDLRAARDELEQRVAERTAELTESENRFRLLAENARDVVFRFRFLPKPKVEYISPAITRIAGHTPEDFYRDPLMAVRLIFQHDRFRVLDLMRRPEVLHTPLELRWRHKDGKTLWVEQRAVPMIEDGRLVALEGISREITERKNAEADLKNEQRFLRQLLEIQERDRTLVAYEIHDGLCQHMTGALMHLEVFARQQPPQEGGPAEQFNQALGLLRETINEARALISGLRPPILDEAGIVQAIDYLVNEARERSGMTLEFQYNTNYVELPRPLENALFRIAQEALTNMTRHSKSRAGFVDLQQQQDFLRLRIQDWGVGFDPSQVDRKRYGLQGIRERARVFGGRCNIETAPGKGTLITVDLPTMLTASMAG